MAQIKHYNDNNPRLQYEVGGFRFYISVAGFSPDKYDWLCEVIQEQADRIFSLAYARGKQEVQQQIKNALGLE